MTRTYTIIFCIVAAILCFTGGSIFSNFRHRASIANYEKREQERMQQISANEAEQNRLRGENDQLRKNIAELSASEEGLKQIITEQGGRISTEAKKLEEVNNDLKNDQAVISAPTDRCTRCQRFSASLLRNKLIDKPLTCADECAGVTH